MYLELSNELIEEIISKKNENTLNNFFNVLDSYAQGNHIVALENRKYSTELEDYFKSNASLENIFYHVYQNHQDNITLRKSLQVYVRVGNSESKFSQHIEKNCVKIFDVPIVYFDNQLLNTSLVTENTVDGYFYKGLVDRMMEENKFGLPQNIVLNCSNDAGGGNQIGPFFHNKAQIEKRITFSICDSDKKSISSKIGETAEVISSVNKRINHNRICDLIILKVREKENLIPPSCYCQHSNYKNFEGLFLLESIENHESLGAEIQYLKISAETDDTTKFFKKQFSRSILANKYNIGKSGVSTVSKEFIYTSKYLKSINQNFKKNSEGARHYQEQYNLFFEKISPDLLKEYMRIAIQLISWTCSFPKLRLAN
ncbi:hypothetical protein IAE51_10895 [Lactococcus sp. S64]|uniref:hypothetical protein n=1 Tax=Lactococcus sp. S64 TaxID=2767459 RepID=UPI001904D9F0|nr:hypothetical protein [Lactococcus sp. S64]MBK0084401.1 hypothetical protein [Lactococcus sp. S64]